MAQTDRRTDTRPLLYAKNPNAWSITSQHHPMMSVACLVP